VLLAAMVFKAGRAPATVMAMPIHLSARAACHSGRARLARQRSTTSHVTR
jgi:hypothetical protein